MYITTQFLLLTTMVLVILTAGAALTHERVERFVLARTITIAARVGDWAYDIHSNVWEAVHTSDWKPGRLGTKWLRFVNLTEGVCTALALRANERLMAIESDEGTFTEADA